MPAQATFDSIATLTADGTTQSLIFNNIPQTFTDLFLAVQVRSTTGAVSDSWQVQVNATSNIYSDVWMRGDGSSATSFRNTSTFGCVMGNCPANNATANIYNAAVVHLYNYTSTNMFKTMVSKSGSDRNGAGTVEQVGGVARTTNAVTRVDVFTSSANMTSGSTVTLFGVIRA